MPCTTGRGRQTRRPSSCCTDGPGRSSSSKAYETPSASVPTKDRPALAARLDERLRQLELAEEQIVLEGALAGHTIQRRPDASALIVLTSVLAE